MLCLQGFTNWTLPELEAMKAAVATAAPDLPSVQLWELVAASPGLDGWRTPVRQLQYDRFSTPDVFVSKP